MQIDIAADRPRVEVTLNDGSTAILSPLVPSDRVYLGRLALFVIQPLEGVEF